MKPQSNHLLVGGITVRGFNEESPIGIYGHLGHLSRFWLTKQTYGFQMFLYDSNATVKSINTSYEWGRRSIISSAFFTWMDKCLTKTLRYIFRVFYSCDFFWLCCFKCNRSAVRFEAFPFLWKSVYLCSGILGFSGIFVK